MSVSGLCEQCGAQEVVDSCERCGRLVCDRHYDDETGYCTKCAGEVTGANQERDRGDRDGKDDGEDRPDGVDEYRF